MHASHSPILTFALLSFAALPLVAACDASAADGGGERDAAVVDPPGDEIPPPPELCNGIDDDGDAVVDEGCSCTRGTTQACWSGAPWQRGQGPCHDGVQTCSGDAEFASWGACVGEVLPTEDVPGNGIDEDCGGEDGPDCAPSESGAACHDGEDNDCDGPRDCADPDCYGRDGCDSCTKTGPVEECHDDIDNNCDGKTDCDDVTCQSSGECTCTKQCPINSERWCDEPTYCNWGKQVCNPDGTWGACVETTDRPPGCTGNIYNPICCAVAGQCCQALPSNESIGTCPPGELVCE